MSKVVKSISIDPRVVVKIEDLLEGMNRNFSNFMEVAAVNLLWDIDGKPEMKHIPGKEID